jgi:hypothetical protein
LKQRLSIFALVLLGHGLALWYLAVITQFKPLIIRSAESSIQVQFVSLPRTDQKPVVFEPESKVPVLKENTKNAQPRFLPTKQKPVATPTTPKQSDAPLKAITADGRVWIPEQARDEFLQHGQHKEFDVQRPGLDDMKKLLDRPIVLEYKSTRFDADWQGEKPRIERILEKAVEKSTATVKIPIPGRPGAYLRCSIAVLALGGGCGFTANDDGYYVKADDPETLSPQEDRQCQAWWDLIVSAKTQDIWRKTRDLYERECRKPLAKP